MRHSLTKFWLFLTLSFTGLTLYILFCFTAVSVSSSPDFAVTSSAFRGQDIFFEDIVIQELPSRPMWSYSTLFASNDSVFFLFDDDAREVQIASKIEGALATLSYPPEYQGYPYRKQYGIPQYERSAGIPIHMECLKEGLFEINAEEDWFRLIEPVDCSSEYHVAEQNFKNEWSPDGRFYAYHVRTESEFFVQETHFYDSWTHQVIPVDEVAKVTTSWLPNWSPHWDYYVEYTRNLFGTLTSCDGRGWNTNIVMYWRDTGEARSVLCLDDWESAEFEKWLNDDDLLIRGFAPQDAAPKREERVIITNGGRDYVELGQSVRSGAVFFDDATKLARTRIHDLNVISDPTECVLNIVDLETWMSVDIQNTFCVQPASLLVDEGSRHLFYLRSVPPVPYGERYVTPELQLVDLDTLHVRALLPEERVQQILSVSADGRYIALISDNSENAQCSIYFLCIWHEPRLLIYDLEQDQIVYEHADKHFDHLYPFLYRSPTVPAFTFRAGTSDKPEEYLVTLDPVTVIPLPKSSGIDFDWNWSFKWREGIRLSRKAEWSPDGTELLVFVNQEAQIIHLTDHTIVPIVKQLQTDEFAVNVEWYGQANQLLVERLPKDGEQTAGRWLVDPELATISYPIQGSAGSPAP